MTGTKLSKEFQRAFGKIEKATDMVKYPYEVHKSARRVDIIPNINNDLMSTGKYANAEHVSIFDEEEVNIYEMSDTTITVSRGSILRGWRDHETGLWRIPLMKNVTNLNTETIGCKSPPTIQLPN